MSNMRRMNRSGLTLLLTAPLLFVSSAAGDAQESTFREPPATVWGQAVEVFESTPLMSPSSITSKPPSLTHAQMVPTANLTLTDTALFSSTLDEITRYQEPAGATPLTHLPGPNSGISKTARDLLPGRPAAKVMAQAETTSPAEAPKESQTESGDADAAKLAKAAQNPIANLISVPFQNNFNFGVGPYDQTQYVLNVQPVIPVSLGPGWLVVNRIITPIINQPTINVDPPSAPGLPPNVDPGYTFGLGDINPQFYFVPKNTGNITWGIGPQFAFPTATTDVTGSGKWSVGPVGVIVYTHSKWVIGALGAQLWSFAGDSDRQAVSQFLLQPFINYNLPKGWYLTTGPQITANWIAEPGEQWTLPLGGGFGRLFKIGKQPINASLQAYGNVIKPENGPDWLLRFQVQLLFPTGGG